MPMLTDLADKLRAYTAPDGSKLTVVETTGWKTRGYAGQGLSGTAGAMHHHTATATSAFAYSDCPTLNLLINGRSDLPGPLCNIAFGRSGTVYVVAAGAANHAGPGSAGGAYVNIGNHYFIGNEMESSGTSNDWTPAQIRIMPHVAAALERAYGGRDFIQIGHKEYSSMGKIDPAFIDMDAMRASVNNILYNSGGATPAAASVTEKEWSELATEKQVEDAAFRAATNAIKEWAATGFTRQGTRAAKAWAKGQTTSLNSILHWWDEAQLVISEANAALLAEVKGLAQRLDTLEKKTTQGTAQVTGGVTLDQLRAVIREEINKTTLGGK